MEVDTRVMADLKRQIEKGRMTFKKSPKERITEAYVTTRLEALEVLIKQFTAKHEGIISTYDERILSKSTYIAEDIFNEGYETYLDYKGELTHALATFQAQNPSTSNKTTTRSSNESMLKLPKISIPTFSGAYSQWTSFRDLFVSLVHNNAALDDVQRLHYLKTQVTGEAERLIKHLPIMQSNYSVCWNLLQSRYNNKRFMSNCILKRLFNQRSMNAESAHAIKDLLDTTSDCLHEMTNLGIDVNSWDVIIIYIISLKLDVETRKQWELQVSNSGEDLPSFRSFREFLEARFRALEFVEPAKLKPRPSQNPVQSNKVLHAVSNDVCPHCSEPHKLYHCKKFGNEVVHTRRDLAKSLNVCFNCLGSNHGSKQCRIPTKCRICHRKHHTLLHPPKDATVVAAGISTETIEEDKIQENADTHESNQIHTHFSSGNVNAQTLLATALVKAESKNGHPQVLRALLDQGSQASFITEAAVQLLRLQKINIKSYISGIGGGTSDLTSKYMVMVNIRSLHDPAFNLRVKAHVLKTVTSVLPEKTFSVQNWPDITCLTLADPQYNTPNRIDILLGSEVYCSILKEGLVKNPSCSLMAQDTYLGWVLSGQISTQPPLKRNLLCMHIQVEEVDILKQFWELEKEPNFQGKILTPEEEACEAHFASTVRRDEEGRYVVELPFRTQEPQCGRTRDIAVKSLVSLEKRLSKNPELHKQYSEVMSEYIQLGHMEVVPKATESCDEKLGKVWLPHHAVVRADKSTTKTRVVFNASSKGTNGVSLNDTLMVGPTLQPDLRHIVMRWRTHPVCLTADIVKMYRQIKVADKHVDFQRIVWRDDDSEIKDHRLLRVTFGTACAPYLAVKSLQQTAIDEGPKYPLAAGRVLNDFFMDDLMTGAETEAEAVQVYNEMNELLAKGCFTLQKWSSNKIELLDELKVESGKDLEIKIDEITKILGLTWNRRSDDFDYSVKLVPQDSVPAAANVAATAAATVVPETKRRIIAEISRLFDPLGWIAPCIITAKVFIQKLWIAGLDWDDNLPEHLLQEWATYRTELSRLVHFHIPRWVRRSKDDISVELHGFSDASNVAYAAVVYMRVLDRDGKIHSNLVTAKTKVAPIKQISIPRLELCGAVLVTKLLEEVAEVLDISKSNIHAWTDSTVVLAWLSDHPSRWKTFIANRTSEILTRLESSQWSYVTSKDNPADVASRGLTPSELVNSRLWKEGPTWLKDNNIDYKRPDSILTRTELEKKVIKAHVTHQEEEELFWVKFSKLQKLVRVIAYCRRFLLLKSPQATRPKPLPYITAAELKEALKCTIRHFQGQFYSKVMKNLDQRHELSSLNPFIDADGVLRVGGRIENSNLPEHSKHPVIIPDKSHLANLIVADAHEKTMHGGQQLTITYLRSKYWIPKVKSLVRSHIHDCVPCIRHAAVTRSQLMGQLPSCRVTPNKPFLCVGVDYAGPINIRVSKGRGNKSYKGYLCLFVCMSSRAVHLEAVSDLSTEGFLAAFKRFVARRGRCNQVWSDNGTNFVGASKELKQLFAKERSSMLSEVANVLANNGTEWNFIPPHAPNFGGLWEAGIKSTKHHLKRVIGDSTLTFEEMSTVLSQIEACLNSRPLWQLSANSDDPAPLTPGHFLVGEPLLLAPDGSYEDDSMACCTALAVLSAAGAGSPAAGPLGPSDRPEAYFNGSSYIRLSRPISLKQLVGLSFRTCVGGELFSQRFEGYTLHVTALFEQVVVSWARPQQEHREVGLAKETLDNRWHWVALRYKPNPPSLLLEVDKDTQVISNVTWNPELLSPGALEAGGAVLLIGNVFSGCIHEGPQLEFHANAQLRHVVFGHCPLTTDDCIDRKDVLRIPPKDHCYNEPCMRHGTCISRHDRYECHCSARYTGNNCEVDAGDPCASAPCLHGGLCQEDSRGDYVCSCTDNYRGTFCELEVSLDPLCLAGPCRNNGSCSVPAGETTYVCDCAPGYTGRNCETDVDECAGAAGACLNGGRCVDAVNNFTCDCTDTGYTGPRCETNVNECELERSLCGAGVCYDTYGGYVCACLPGYTGEHCHRMSACAAGPCGAGGVCVEEAGGSGFRCVCARGLVPPLCTPPAPPVPPQTAACPACPPHSHCVTTSVGGATTKQAMCICDLGYYGASGPSPNCSVVESACEAGVCLNGAVCSQAPDHFNCSCAPGYKGVYCEQAAGKALSDLKLERCAAAPCVHAAACVDLPSGGFQCECEAGWSGPRCDAPTGPECPRACLNGGSCVAAPEGPACECRAGFAPPYCELALDCRASSCPPHQECVESNGAWRCAVAGADSACASSPCHNGTCLALGAGLFQCQCAPGTTGRYCETDIDECALKPKICNNGVCVNVPGSFQCYCRPGYTGDSCEQDIDECLSSPCKNGGTCLDLENNYECTCMDGFEGKDCSININECESNPCASGSTCVDGINSYSCVCQEGLTGPTCEVNIDDCESQPCQHNGRCIDGLNSYTCECAGTGYSGDDCSVNIDECAPQPCRHGGTCVDDVNDYRCECHPAYSGKNCEIDINECESEPCKYDGVCLERSNASLYLPADAPPVLVGPQPQMLLPHSFYRAFSLEDADGFECVCVQGTTGSRCEVNIDECADSPCGHGKCIDGVGGYTCECFPGYEGSHCDQEIDECERYQPCLHGRCVDRRASYQCVCEEGWGGHNCTVVLTGCAGQPCRNNGSCHPWLLHETEHRFNCSCAPGHLGTTCEKITTMSLEKSSYVELNTSREEGYDISFRFKTTLGNGLLAMGRGLTYFFLELSNGRLNLHSSLLNKWEGVFIGSNLNDSNWQKVFVTINSSHLVLAANEEQTIYPISQLEAFNSSVTSFPHTRLGTAGSSYATLTHGPNFYVGCFQDVVVNGQPVLPEPGAMEGATLRGVQTSCPRTPQCAPNPCRSGGVCADNWSSFACACPRPYLGDTCQYNYTAATFGHESAAKRSVVTVDVSERARRSVLAALDISMFIMTRKPNGQIFYLGTLPRYGQTEETQVGASLENGELLVHLRFNQTPENYTVGGTRLDNGHLHLIEVVRNATLVQVKLNGTEYFRKSISAAKFIDAQVLYLGGPPPIPQPPIQPPPTSTAPPGVPPVSQGPPVTASPPPLVTLPPIPQPDENAYFKGVIQDVQISNGVNVTIVEFFPLRIPGLSLPASFGSVSLEPAAVLSGVVSDDVCASSPCAHNASCTNTWNDFTCQCPRGYKGKQCSEVEFCQLQGCPLNSQCRNLDTGYECVSNATFDGNSTTLSYRLRLPRQALPAAHTSPPDSLTVTYRTKRGGTLVHAVSGGDSFTVGVFKEQVSVHWRLRGALSRAAHLRAPSAAHPWSTLRFTLRRGTITASFVDGEGREENGVTLAIDVSAWQRLLMDGTIHLGGVGDYARGTTISTLESSTDLNELEYMEGDNITMDNLDGEYFKGCLGAVHVGSLLLPYFTEAELFVGAAAALLAAQPHYALISGRPWGAAQGLGCVLCLEQDCEHGGHCADVRSQYVCACLPGYGGDYCEIDIDECVNNECQNEATCKDEVAAYSCICPPGYDGQLCEHDIDECSSSPCLHGGTCHDLVGGFSCACATAWRGHTCAEPEVRTCAHQPCSRGAAECLDVVPDPPTGNNFTCQCSEGYSGALCSHAWCADSCAHGHCDTSGVTPACQCSRGWAGALCDQPRDECAERGLGPCLHGGVCTLADGDAHCDCHGTGWSGLRCETDVDECALGTVSCGPGDCVNLEGSYTCVCTAGYCGRECALRDPCFEPADGGDGGNGTGPCRHGARCEQRCADTVDYVCHCVDSWAGPNCTQQIVSSGSESSGAGSAAVLIGVGAALLALAVLGALLGAAGAQARRKRATRGTYSPSGQEYCNPRAEAVHNALKPPPEERLI